MASAVSKVKRQKSHLSFTILQNVPAAIGVCVSLKLCLKFITFIRGGTGSQHIYIGQWATWNWFYPSTLWVP